MRTRLTLIHRLQGDATNQDWETFQSFYWSVITGWARARGCPHQMVEDVYQDTMVSLLRYLPSYDPEKAKFRAFLKTITMRRIDDAWRRYYRENPQKGGEEDPPPPIVTALEDIPADLGQEASEDEVVWLAGVVSEALQRTFDRLEDTTYKSFCRNILEGASIERICEEFGVSRNAIYNHKNRTLTILCEEIAAVLNELNDDGLPDLMTDKPEAMKHLRACLEAYVSNREDLRATQASVSVPYAMTMRIHDFAIVLAKHPPPSDTASWLRVFAADDAYWAEITDGMTIGSKAGADLHLQAKGVSRLHASIHKRLGGAWEIVDEQSTHGLWVCGKRVSSWTLRGGDQLQVGSALLYYIPG